ncbi:hypothetical protein BJX99DRAFT_223252 [Aspergillus californicus]
MICMQIGQQNVTEGTVSQSFALMTLIIMKTTCGVCMYTFLVDSRKALGIYR